jgi:hypothetical protein
MTECAWNATPRKENFWNQEPRIEKGADKTP